MEIKIPLYVTDYRSQVAECLRAGVGPPTDAMRQFLVSVDRCEGLRIRLPSVFEQLGSGSDYITESRYCSSDDRGYYGSHIHYSLMTAIIFISGWAFPFSYPPQRGCLSRLSV